MIKNDESELIEEVLSHPGDPDPRSVYADWLEDHGDARAEYLRVAEKLSELEEDDAEFARLSERFQELHKTIAAVDADWLTTLSQSPIENCRHTRARFKFKFRCPKQWDQLQRTENSRVRFCDQCEKHVFYCRNVSDIRKFAWQGKCVAIDPAVPRSEGDLEPRRHATLGKISPNF